MRSNMVITLSVLCATGVLTGCSTFGDKKEDAVAEVAPVANTVQIPQNQIDTIPDWFLSKEIEDKKFIVVTATDISKDMQFAIDKATLSAKIQIAERLRTDVESLVRESVLESGVGIKDVEREVDRVTKVKIKQSIGFFKRENIAVYKEGENYRAYVMFRISVEDARRLTQKDSSRSREDRFKELEVAPTPTPTEAPIAPVSVQNPSQGAPIETATVTPVR